MKHMYMCIHLWSWSLVRKFTCMLSRQTLKLGYLDTTYVFSGEVQTLSCYRSDPIIMKFLSEQFVLKLCQIDNLCQSWGKLKFLLMKINFTFSGGQKLRIFGRSWNFLRSQFWNLEQFFWNFVRKIICKKSPQYLTLFYFTASDSVVPIQQDDTSNVEEASYFTAWFAFRKMFECVARFVNAATTKKTHDKDTLMVLNFRLNIYLHVISINFETGLPRYNLCIIRRGWNFVMFPVWSNHYEIFVRTISSETLSNR